MGKGKYAVNTRMLHSQPPTSYSTSLFLNSSLDMPSSCKCSTELKHDKYYSQVCNTLCDVLPA